MTTHATQLPKSLELYGYWRSSASWRVRWALELKGALYTCHPVNLLSGEHRSESFKKINPAGLVPALVVDQKKVLTQSSSIIEWIEETYNLEEARLFPGDFFRRAKIRELCQIINAETAPLQTPRVQNRHSQNPDEKSAWAAEWIRAGLNSFVTASHDSRGLWSAGDEVTAADLFLVPQIYNAIRFGIDVKKDFPVLWSIYDRALKTPECHKASPEQQIDAIIK